jgi:hypothetical protein
VQPLLRPKIASFDISTFPLIVGSRADQRRHRGCRTHAHATPEGHTHYGRRKVIPEPVFG